MAYKYAQKSGELTNLSGNLIGTGYSGNGEGLNNPALQDDPGVGPIPQGDWAIGDFFDDLGGKGPIVAHLKPMPGTETFGRSGFMIHGDNAAMDHTASHGCLVLPHPLRAQIAASAERQLTVTA
jgi:hypothetical protein